MMKFVSRIDFNIRPTQTLGGIRSIYLLAFWEGIPSAKQHFAHRSTSLLLLLHEPMHNVNMHLPSLLLQQCQQNYDTGFCVQTEHNCRATTSEQVYHYSFLEQRIPRLKFSSWKSRKY